jgi:hypothetical protein
MPKRIPNSVVTVADSNPEVDANTLHASTATSTPSRGLRTVRRRPLSKHSSRPRWVYRVENAYARFVGPHLRSLLHEICDQTKGRERLLLRRARMHARGASKTHVYRGWTMSRSPIDVWRPDDELAASDVGEVTVVLPLPDAPEGDGAAALTMAETQ